MRCPACGGDTAVIKSRLAGAGLVMRRRRECSVCGERFTTRETIVRDEVVAGPTVAVPVQAVPAASEDAVVPARRIERRPRSVADEFNPFDEDQCFIPEC